MKGSNHYCVRCPSLLRNQHLGLRPQSSEKQLCHVEKNSCSVPLKYVRATVDLMVTSKMQEIYLPAERLSSHLLVEAPTVNRYRTNNADIPPEHLYRS